VLPSFVAIFNRPQFHPDPLPGGHTPLSGKSAEESPSLSFQLAPTSLRLRASSIVRWALSGPRNRALRPEILIANRNIRTGSKSLKTNSRNLSNREKFRGFQAVAELVARSFEPASSVPVLHLRTSRLRFQAPNLRKAKKRLIATLANSEIELTRRNKLFYDFLIATKTAPPQVANSLRRCHALLRAGPRGVDNTAREWPCRTDRAKMGTRLLLLKILLGDTSGLQDRACSLFYLARPK
jgi:hypothetical protein